MIYDVVGLQYDRAFLSSKRLGQTIFPLKIQYRKNLRNQFVDIAKVKCNICAWIVVGKFILNQHLKTENSKSYNTRNVMNYAWRHDMQWTKW